MPMLNVIVACEFSGVVREAFRKRGHNAWSCDILPSDDNSPYHFQDDIFNVLGRGEVWDMMIAHPPCTHLSVSGARHFAAKRASGVQQAALEFARRLLEWPIEHICLENPVSIISTQIRMPDQVINPWQFGHGEKKRTCLWLKNLPLLQPTDIVEGREPVVHWMAPGPLRSKKRSVTYQGIADAMAQQWGSIHG